MWDDVKGVKNQIWVHPLVVHVFVCDLILMRFEQWMRLPQQGHAIDSNYVISLQRFPSS